VTDWFINSAVHSYIQKATESIKRCLPQLIWRWKSKVMKRSKNNLSWLLHNRPGKTLAPGLAPSARALITSTSSWLLRSAILSWTSPMHGEPRTCRPTIWPGPSPSTKDPNCPSELSPTDDPSPLHTQYTSWCRGYGHEYTLCGPVGTSADWFRTEFTRTQTDSISGLSYWYTNNSISCSDTTWQVIPNDTGIIGIQSIFLALLIRSISKSNWL